MGWKSEEEFHQHLGRFCADFELVCHGLEICIRTILHKNGLVSLDIQEILLSGSTAEPLTKLLQSLVGHLLGTDDNKRSIFNKVFKRVRELTEHRNALIHSKWFVYGKALQEEKEEIISVGQRLYANKHGADTQHIVVDQNNLSELIAECREVSIMISLLSRCIEGIRSTEECFTIKDGGLVINYEALRPVQINA
jgi:hypothetical protein